MKILVVEDDKKVAGFIRQGLREEQYTVDTAYDGEEGLLAVRSNHYDVVILDVMMPKKDGFEVCKAMRSEAILTPVLMLTARDHLEDKVKGLKDGADDYLTKPFAFEELLARIEALLRRGSNYKAHCLKVGDLELDPISRKVIRENKMITLTGKEFALLEYLMKNKGRVITQAMISDQVWEMDFDGLSNVVNVYINHLRDKVDKGFSKRYIHTVRGSGYKIDENTDS